MSDASQNGLDGQTAKLFAFFFFAGLALDMAVMQIELGDSREIDGAPAWNWYPILFLQTAVYPPLFVLAARTALAKMTLLPWMRSSWRDRGRDSFYERCWFAAFGSYLVRDTIRMVYVRDFGIFFPHHIACLAGVAFALWIPSGTVAMLAGMFSLEVGSLALTCTKVLPPFGPNSDVRWDRLYWYAMPISNVLCLLCCAYNAFVPFRLKRRVLEGVFKAFFTLLTVVLTFKRQEVALEHYWASEERYASLGESKRIPDDEKLLGDDAAAYLTYGVSAAWIIVSMLLFWRSFQAQHYRFFPDDPKKAR